MKAILSLILQAVLTVQPLAKASKRERTRKMIETDQKQRATTDMIAIT
jgi:hypothetical protein